MNRTGWAIRVPICYVPHAPAAWEHLTSAIGIVTLAAAAVAWQLSEPTPAPDSADLDAYVVAMAGTASPSTNQSTSRRSDLSRTRREILAGGYLGVTHTHPSTVAINNPGRTDMTVRDFQWEGKPFKSPIYYGARIVNWPGGSRLGTMLDFTHAKAIARFEDEATFTGTHEGRPLAPKAKVGDVFKHLEFSHGHNMLTLNAMTRLGSFAVQPYIGAGAGISLPHTEIAFRTENGRTYEYQYAGLVGQALAGVQIRLGRATVFFEYKFSYAPYEVPLSGVVNGGYLFMDIWRQAKAWFARDTPPAGRLATPLLTHHAIGGVLLRTTSATAPQ